MSHDDRNNDEKQRDKILQKYGLQITGGGDLSDLASDMAADAKILKEIAARQSDVEDDDDDDNRRDDDDDDDRGERRRRDDD
jgi:hypothetical protein